MSSIHRFISAFDSLDQNSTKKKRNFKHEK